jgi:hypothetical protein
MTRRFPSGDSRYVRSCRSCHGLQPPAFPVQPPAPNINMVPEPYANSLPDTENAPKLVFPASQLARQEQTDRLWCAAYRIERLGHEGGLPPGQQCPRAPEQPVAHRPRWRALTGSGLAGSRPASLRRSRRSGLLLLTKYRKWRPSGKNTGSDRGLRSAALQHGRRHPPSAVTRRRAILGPGENTIRVTFQARPGHWRPRRRLYGPTGHGNLFQLALGENPMNPLSGDQKGSGPLRAGHRLGLYGPRAQPAKRFVAPPLPPERDVAPVRELEHHGHRFSGAGT